MALKNPSILASLTGCYMPAITHFIEARKQQNRPTQRRLTASGLATTAQKPRPIQTPIPELVKGFKEEVFGQPLTISSSPRSSGPNASLSVVQGYKDFYIQKP